MIYFVAMGLVVALGWLTAIWVELRKIRKAVAPRWDINFSPTLNLTKEQSRRMALAAMKAMQDDPAAQRAVSEMVDKNKRREA